jgi:hypothetical protein
VHKSPRRRSGSAVPRRPARRRSRGGSPARAATTRPHLAHPTGHPHARQRVLVGRGPDSTACRAKFRAYPAQDVDPLEADLGAPVGQADGRTAWRAWRARSEVTRPAARRDDAGFEWRELVAGPVEQDEVGVGVPNRAQPTANHHPSRLGESTSSSARSPRVICTWAWPLGVGLTAGSILLEVFGLLTEGQPLVGTLVSMRISAIILFPAPAEREGGAQARLNGVPEMSPDSTTRTCPLMDSLERQGAGCLRGSRCSRSGGQRRSA